MKRLTLLLCLLIAGVWIAGQAQTAKKYPSRFPLDPVRDDSKKLFENERVIVWEENLSTEHYMHQHVLDSFYFTLHDAPVETMDANGKIGKQFNNSTPNGVPTFGGGMTRSGRGPHSEKSLDPNNKRRRFYVEMKGTALLSCREWSTDPMCK